MKLFLLVLAFVANGKPVLVTVPAEDPTECSVYVQRFVDAEPDKDFEATCVPVLKVLSHGLPQRRA